MEQKELNEIREMEMLNKTEQYVAKVLEKAENNHDLIHSQKTVWWIRQLKSNADEALLIAGALHDIERAINGDWKAGTSDVESLRNHQDTSADEAEKFLKQENVSEDTIKRVRHLICAHETGGDEDQNILCDADCLAWFEDKAIRNVQKHKAQGKPREQMKEKLDYLVSRISTEKAKEIVRKWYEEALEELGKN
jgi:MoxR-like ATPase